MAQNWISDLVIKILEDSPTQILKIVFYDNAWADSTFQHSKNKHLRNLVFRNEVHAIL